MVAEQTTTRDSRGARERAREASADLERAPRRDAPKHAPSRPTEVGRALARRARRAGEGGVSRPRTRPETGRAAQPRRREVDGEAKEVAGTGDAKRRAPPHRDRRGQAKAADGVSRTGPRETRASGARARRLFGYRRGGGVPGADDARTRRRPSESLARHATEGVATLLRGNATPPAASTGPYRRVTSAHGTPIAPEPLTSRARHGDHGGGRGRGPRDRRSRPGRRRSRRPGRAFVSAGGASRDSGARAGARSGGPRPLPPCPRCLPEVAARSARPKWLPGVPARSACPKNLPDDLGDLRARARARARVRGISTAEPKNPPRATTHRSRPRG